MLLLYKCKKFIFNYFLDDISENVTFSETNYDNNQILCLNRQGLYYYLHFKITPNPHLLKINEVTGNQPLLEKDYPGILERFYFFFIRRNINFFSIFSFRNKQPFGILNKKVGTIAENITNMEQNWYILPADL